MTGVSYEVNEGIVTSDPLMRQEPSALEAAQKLYAEQKGNGSGVSAINFRIRTPH
jgi:hypothetical protein